LRTLDDRNAPLRRTAKTLAGSCEELYDVMNFRLPSSDLLAFTKRTAEELIAKIDKYLEEN
jgi:hypothetical protein